MAVVPLKEVECGVVQRRGGADALCLALGSKRTCEKTSDDDGN